MLVGAHPHEHRYRADEAVEAIRGQASQAFDPQVVNAFLEVVQSESPRGSELKTAAQHPNVSG